MTDIRSLVASHNNAYGGAPGIAVAANGDGTATVASYGGGNFTVADVYRVDRDGTPHGDGLTDRTGPWALDEGDPPFVRVVGNGDGTATVAYQARNAALVSRTIDSGGARAETQTITPVYNNNTLGFGLVSGSGNQVTATWQSQVPAPEWGETKTRYAVMTAQRDAPAQPGGGPPPPPPPPPGPPDPNDCTRVKLIGAAGSGENDHGVSLGSPIGALVNGRHSAKLQPSQRFDGLRTLIDDHKYGGYGSGAFQDYALPYPALNVPWAIAIGAVDPFGVYTPFNYQKSVQSGVSALLKELNRDATLNRACLQRSPAAGGTRYVLAGYSQGAHVIGDVLASPRLDPFMRRRIASVVMFGDPKWNASDVAVEHLGSFSDETQTTVFGDPLSGILGPREAGSLRGAPNEYSVLSYCAIRDVVCQLYGNKDSHMHYDTVENAGQAAKLVYLKLRRLLK